MSDKILIIGAGGHALEILDLIKGSYNQISFFDNLNKENKLIYDSYRILKSFNQVEDYFDQDNRTFCIGFGGTNRLAIQEKFISLGGLPHSIISSTATISNNNTFLGSGLNIMHNVLISSNVKIGDSSLINSFTSIHHDVEIGNSCEIAPHSAILGNVVIGDNTLVGANATILPGCKIGKNVVIGAGAVVTKNIPNNQKVFGIPAKSFIN